MCFENKLLKNTINHVTYLNNKILIRKCKIMGLISHLEHIKGGNNFLKGLSIYSDSDFTSIAKKYFYLLLVLAVGVISFFVRTYRIDETFWAFGDQIRDWSIALNGDLPLHGTPKVGGGFSWGPIHYWVLRVIALTIGGFFDNLPHAGGYGFALLRSLADGFLFWSLTQLGFASLGVTGVMLLIITLPLESALSGIIWNPGLAITFLVFSLGSALCLLKKKQAFWGFFALLAAVLGIHAHTPLIFWALANILSIFIISAFAMYSNPEKVKSFFLWSIFSLICVFLVQLPYLIHIATTTANETYLNKGLNSIFRFELNKNVLFGLLHRSLEIVGIKIDIFSIFILTPILILVIARLIKERIYEITIVFAIGIVSFLCAVLIFAMTGLPVDSYWLMNLAYPLFLPVLIMTFKGWENSFLRMSSVFFSFFLFTFAIVNFQDRFNVRDHQFRFPEYGSISRGISKLKNSHKVLKSIHIDFETVHPFNAESLYRFLGGQISKKDGSEIVSIHRDGTYSVQTSTNSKSQ